jgi:hypothetical protein
MGQSDPRRIASPGALQADCDDTPIGDLDFLHSGSGRLSEPGFALESSLQIDVF